MDHRGIIILVIATMFITIMANLTQRTRKPTKLGEMKGGILLMHGAWAAFLMGVAPIISYFYAPSADIWVGLLFVSPFGFISFIHFLSVRYTYTDEYIERTSLVSFPDVYLWKNLHYSYNLTHVNATRGVSFKFHDGSFSVPAYLDNYDDFINFIKNKELTPEK